MYDNQSEESRRRSDPGRTDRRSYQPRLLASRCDSCHNLHQHYHATRGRAADCPRHQRNRRARSSSSSVQRGRQQSRTPTSPSVNLVQLGRAYRHAGHHFAHLRSAQRPVFCLLHGALGPGN